MLAVRIDLSVLNTFVKTLMSVRCVMYEFEFDFFKSKMDSVDEGC